MASLTIYLSRLIGLLTLIAALSMLVDWFRFEKFFYLYVGFAAVLGLYITVHGFSAAAARRAPQNNRSG